MAFHIACMLADRFGVITLPELITPELQRRWRLIGIDSARITSVRCINMTGEEISQRKAEWEERFIEIAKKQIIEEGAQAILIGCLAITTHIIPGSRERLEDKLGVPVIDGSPITIKMAELMVTLGLKQSKVAYPR